MTLVLLPLVVDDLTSSDLNNYPIKTVEAWFYTPKPIETLALTQFGQAAPSTIISSSNDSGMAIQASKWSEAVYNYYNLATKWYAN